MRSSTGMLTFAGSWLAAAALVGCSNQNRVTDGMSGSDSATYAGGSDMAPATGGGDAMASGDSASGSGYNWDGAGSSSSGSANRNWPMMSSSEDMQYVRMAYPTGDASTSAVGIEKGFPTQVRAGSPFSYEIIVTNLTGLTLESVTVNDAPNAGMRMLGADPSADMSMGGATWNLGSLAPGEQRTIRVEAQADAEGEVGTCASVSYNSTLCATVPVVRPAIELTKSGPAEVLECEPINYTMTVSNTGTATVRGLELRDDLQDGLRAADGSSVISAMIDRLDPGESRNFAAVAEATRTGNFSNTATVSGDGLSADSGTVNTRVVKPMLEISHECRGEQYANRPICYDIVVRNIGDGEARDTVITQNLPAGTSFRSASNGGASVGNNVTWSLGTLAPGQEVVLESCVSPAAIGSYESVITANAFCSDAAASTCNTEVKGIPAILLEVIDEIDPVQVGEETIYVITVTNQGTARDTNVRIVATLEDTQEAVSATGTTRADIRGATIACDPVPVLLPGEVAEWRIRVRGVGAGDVRFAVDMTSDELTRSVNETEATNVYN
ncbi:MAG: hypothetical protein AB8G96_16935 [Phycisphaerales bacterium]